MLEIGEYMTTLLRFAGIILSLSILFLLPILPTIILAYSRKIKSIGLAFSFGIIYYLILFTLMIYFPKINSVSHSSDLKKFNPNTETVYSEFKSCIKERVKYVFFGGTKIEAYKALVHKQYSWDKASVIPYFEYLYFIICFLTWGFYSAIAYYFLFKYKTCHNNQTTS